MTTIMIMLWVSQYDNSLPEYTTERSTIPYNIERDGTLWTIPANDGNSYNFDQKSQWQISVGGKACYGYRL